MNVLVIDCFGSSREERRAAEEYVALVRRHLEGKDCEITVRDYKNRALQDYMWVQKGDWGIDPKVLEVARVMFREQDIDDSGTLDEYELFCVINLLMSRLGMEVDSEFLIWIEEQVKLSMQEFDVDLSG